MPRRPLFVAALAVALAVQAAPASAWQDLAPDFVRARVAAIAASETPAADRQRAVWTLLSVGRAAVDPLIQVVETAPELAWTAVGLLDTLRTDAQVVTRFSAWLDAPPPGLRSTGEVAGLLGSRLQDMVNQRWTEADTRRAWVAANAPYLRFDRARFRFVVDRAAKRAGRALIPTPPTEGASAAAEAAFQRPILALHSGYEPAYRALVGGRVAVVNTGGRAFVEPKLDVGAFADPVHNHRALTVRDRDDAWLVRSGDAWFHFSKGDTPTVLRAGMKPID